MNSQGHMDMEHSGFQLIKKIFEKKDNLLVNGIAKLVFTKTIPLLSFE
jgi:hypothetical protein